MPRRRFKLFLLIVLLTGGLALFLNLKHSEEPVIPDQPDRLPFRINVTEIQGEMVWPIPDVTAGLPLSHIRDLGANKPRALLVIIVSTAPVRWERRDAIRQTWWKRCNTKEVSDHITRTLIGCVVVLHIKGFIKFGNITRALIGSAVVLHQTI